MLERFRLHGAAALAVALPLAVLAQTPAPDAPQPSPRQPKWEAGLVAGGGYVPDYPGADQSHRRGLVAPLVIYRGPVLRIDQSGIRGRLFGRHDLELDFTAHAAFSARDNEARAGMPGLDYLFGVGPQLVYKGLRRAGSPTLHLKANAIASTDFERVDGRGATFEVELRWRRYRFLGVPVSWTFGLQPTWASRPLQSYFYQVPAENATPTRPAYAARAGYLGTELKLTLSRPVNPSLSWFFALRALSLRGAANRDSPLMRRDANVLLGAGVIWTPWRSNVVVAGDM
jgi:outer membrane scaffolding protein for murein synthesis (MipA/OmpV family)